MAGEQFLAGLSFDALVRLPGLIYMLEGRSLTANAGLVDLFLSL
jgi:hypothetical protein